MRLLSSFIILAVLGFMCTPVFGQCVLPYTEDFETTTPLSTTCVSVGTTTYPNGWNIDPASTQNWNADVNGTSSSLTGPSVDHNPGNSTGIYLYTETSGTACTNGTAILNSPVYDITGMTMPSVKFWYHMYGAAMGTLTLEVWDGVAWLSPTTMPAAGFTMSGDQGDTWFSATIPLLPYVDPACPMSTAAKFRFVGMTGTTFTSDMAIDDVTVFDGVTGWETNDAVSSLDIDGVQGDPFVPAIVSKTTYICGGTPAPLVSLYTLASNMPGAGFDIVTSGLPLVSGAPGGGGLPLADGQFINIDLFGGPFTAISGGTPLFLPLSNLPGANDVSVSVAVTSMAAGTSSAQAVVFDATAPLGFVLSQGVQLDIAVLPADPSAPGPTTLTGITSVDVVNAPTCWSTTGGVSFYGTSFSTINVFAGGTVQFGASDTDTSPSLADAFDGPGRVGFWTALDPSEGGTVTISSPMQDVIRVDWAGVFYDAGGPGVTFGIQFDCLTGVITLDGLQGIAPNPNFTATTDDQWLGICQGTTFPGTTIPPPAGFGPGLNGSSFYATDMLYEFNDVSATMMGIPASIAAGMNVLTFTPITVGMGTGYMWSGT